MIYVPFKVCVRVLLLGSRETDVELGVTRIRQGRSRDLLDSSKLRLAISGDLMCSIAGASGFIAIRPEPVFFWGGSPGREHFDLSLCRRLHGRQGSC